jgi:hypothetical protein
MRKSMDGWFVFTNTCRKRVLGEKRRMKNAPLDLRSLWFEEGQSQR